MPVPDLSLVTLSLRNLLDANVRRLMGGALPADLDVTTMPPEDVTAGTATLNLHLYAVMEDPHFKNAVGLPNASPPISGQPMALRLYYILTPHLRAANLFDAAGQQRVMGMALKTLHDFPVITDSLQITPSLGEGPQTIMEPPLSGAENRIEISMRPLEPEETINFWSTEDARTPRLSAFYEVRTVLLEPEQPSSITGTVFDVGLYVKSAASARINGSRSELRFTMPDETGLGDQSIAVTPARTTLRAVAAPGRPFVKVLGSNLTSGDAREVTIRAFAWAQPEVIDPALNPDWRLEVSTGEIRFIPHATLNVDDGAGGVDVLVVAPGGHEIGLNPITYRFQGTQRLETRFDAGRAAIGFAPQIDLINGPDGNGHFQIDIDPVVDLTLPGTTIALAIGGEVYAQDPVVALIPSAPGLYQVAANSILFDPSFAVPGTYPVQLVVNGVESQPFWVEA